MSSGRRTRREFLAHAAATGSLAVALPASALVRTVAPVANALPPPTRDAVPVVSFHLDRPYVDFSAESIPYVPPPGARAAQALCGLSEEDLFRLPL